MTPTTRRSRDLAARGVEAGEALRALTTFDVRWACDVLRPVYDATDGVDGRVSIEVDPRLAHDTDGDDRRGPGAVVAGGPAQPVHQDPGRPSGPAGDRRVPGRGNQHQRHADLLPGPLRRRSWTPSSTGWNAPCRPGGTWQRIGSVASFFVSRVDTEVDARLDKIGTARGRRAARAGRHRQRPARLPALRAGARLAALEGAGGAGARPQRPLWASTSTKDPAYPDTRYVVDLVAPGVVNTMPEATLRAVADHGQVPRRLGTRPLRRRPAGTRSAASGSASTTTTSCRRSKTMAWPSSRRAGTGCASNWP